MRNLTFKTYTGSEARIALLVDGVEIKVYIKPSLHSQLCADVEAYMLEVTDGNEQVAKNIIYRIEEFELDDDEFKLFTKLIALKLKEIR